MSEKTLTHKIVLGKSRKEEYNFFDEKSSIFYLILFLILK